MFALKSKIQKLGRLKKRSDFLRIQHSGSKWVAKGLIIVAAPNDLGTIRFGLTVTKKLSKSAVERNRIKRRLRAAACDVLPESAKEGMDYVLIGKRESAARLYKDMQNDLRWCLGKLGCAKEIADKESTDKGEPENG